LLRSSGYKGGWQLAAGDWQFKVLVYLEVLDKKLLAISGWRLAVRGSRLF
jgi:hypothetical protein